VVGVRVHDQLVRARRAVLADVAAEHLYGRLFEELPPRVRDKMAGFRRDPGTVKVDCALRGPVPWRTPPPHAPGTVHISDAGLPRRSAGSTWRPPRYTPAVAYMGPAA
jgi:phytoene dehydrogenase-like protein